MTKLSFFGAISEIGGNCVVLEEDGHRLMMDNGMCFSKENMYFKEFLSARGGNDTRDYITLELIPAINGIYGKDVLKDVGYDVMNPKGRYLLETEVESYESYIEKNKSPFIEGLLLSHAHFDHFRNLLFMHPEIPIYCSQITYDILEITSELSFQDFLKYTYSQLGNLGSGSYFPGAIKKDNLTIDRKFVIMEPAKSYEIGPFTVTGYSTDHSLVGSMGFQILTKNGKKIVYTGDIRFHGRKEERENSENFVDTVSKSKTDALISEGTKIDSEKEISEDDVSKEVLNHLKENKGYQKKLVLASFPWKNITRFLTVYEIAKELKRTIAIHPKLAYMLHNLGNNESLGVKDILHNDDIRIYLPRKRSMLYSLGDYVNSKACISYDVDWEKKVDYKVHLYEDLYGDDKLIEAYQIHNAPGKYILQLQFYDITELIDLQPPEDSIFFSLKTEPYDEEGEIEQKILENWLNKYKLHLISIHASGHAPKKHLIDMIEKIKPNILFPIHTEHPDMFKMKNVIKDIVLGKDYEI